MKFKARTRAVGALVREAMRATLCLCLLGAVLFTYSLMLQCVSSRAIDVLIIPHSHTDPGWKDTDEGYLHQVSAILNGVMTELSRGPNDFRANEQAYGSYVNGHRKFVWGETCFFKWWYDSLSESLRLKVQQLVASGRIEFVGGGWVQHDESAATIGAAIEQLELGLSWIKRTFPFRNDTAVKNEPKWPSFPLPVVGWQLDPFGHSSVTPQIFGTLGYDSLVANRIHYTDKLRRRKQQQLEFFWQWCEGSCCVDVDAYGMTSPSTAMQATCRSRRIWTHVLFAHYSSPYICHRVIDCERSEEAPMISLDIENSWGASALGDGVDGSVTNVAEAVVKYIEAIAPSYVSNNSIVFLLGDDF